MVWRALIVAPLIQWLLMIHNLLDLKLYAAVLHYEDRTTPRHTTPHRTTPRCTTPQNPMPSTMPSCHAMCQAIPILLTYRTVPYPAVLHRTMRHHTLPYLPVALIAQWLERELRRRRSWVQVLPCVTERVRSQSTQSLWRITCPPPEQTPSTCWKTHWVKKKEENTLPYLPYRTTPCRTMPLSSSVCRGHRLPLCRSTSRHLFIV